MTTKKQTAANGPNSKHSTGPNTPEGKLRSSLNALNHGMTAKRRFLPDEDPAEFDAYLSALLIEFDPETESDHDLVEFLADVGWRLRRVCRFEALSIEALMDDVMNDEDLRQLVNLDDRIPSDTEDSSDLREICKAQGESLAEVASRYAGEQLFARAVVRAFEKDIFGKAARYGSALLNQYTRIRNELERKKEERDS